LPDKLPKMTSQPEFDWNDLRFLLTVARTGSTLAAAKVLGVSQSTVHRRLAELEVSIGRQLVKRHPSGYRLTELGEELRPQVEHIEEAIDALKRHLTSSDRRLVGTVRITCPTLVAYRLQASSLLELFQARHPGLRVELVLSDQIVDLAKGQADIAIRASEPEDEALVGRKIAEGRWALYASRSYVARHGRPECQEDINRHFVIGGRGGMASYPAVLWLRSVAPHATVGATCDYWAGYVLALKSGAGLAPLLISVGDQESELVRLLDIGSELVTPFYLLMHRDLQRTPRVRAFFDFVVAEIKAFRAALIQSVDHPPTEAASMRASGNAGPEPSC
jgi:DNA-binding transcriptional LysR family regulator